MSSKWYSTLEESRAQFGGYKVNPNKPTERIFTRVFYGIDKVEFLTLRATIDSTTTITSPIVDNQTYPGTWRIDDIRTEEGTGELAGSLTVYQDIANKLNDGIGPGNEYLAGVQSQLIELIEYRWMVYQHYKKTTTKKWTALTSSATQEVYDLLYRIVPESEVASTSIAVSADRVPSLTTWTSKYYNMVVGRTDGTYWKFDDPGDPYSVVTHSDGSLSYNLWLGHSVISQPIIESCYYQEQADRSFIIYRSLTELTYPAIMRDIYYQYAGLIVTSTLPVEDSNTIKLSGFLNQTEKIYEDARFRIGSDTYRVTADATCVDGAVTLAVTPYVTADTAEAHMFDVSNIGAQVFFNAIG